MRSRTFQQRYQTLLARLGTETLLEGDQEFFNECQNSGVLLPAGPEPNADPGTYFHVEVFAGQGGYILANDPNDAVRLVRDLVNRYSSRSQSGLQECFKGTSNRDPITIRYQDATPTSS